MPDMSSGTTPVPCQHEPCPHPGDDDRHARESLVDTLSAALKGRADE